MSLKDYRHNVAQTTNVLKAFGRRHVLFILFFHSGEWRSKRGEGNIQRPFKLLAVYANDLHDAVCVVYIVQIVLCHHSLLHQCDITNPTHISYICSYSLPEHSSNKDIFAGKHVQYIRLVACVTVYGAKLMTCGNRGDSICRVIVFPLISISRNHL